jgi:sec-independent protein translocase protein TatA
MVGLDNPLHIAFLLVIVLLVFGAKRLPEMGKSLGAGLRGFKESISGEHEHQSLMAVTEHEPTRVDDTLREAHVDRDPSHERSPAQPAA